MTTPVYAVLNIPDAGGLDHRTRRRPYFPASPGGNAKYLGMPELVSTPEVVILIGFQGAGKSTFRAQRFDGTHALVSKDRLRNNRRHERRQQRLIAEALAAGQSVVVDNTNP